MKKPPSKWEWTKGNGRRGMDEGEWTKGNGRRGMSRFLQKQREIIFVKNVPLTKLMETDESGKDSGKCKTGVWKSRWKMWKSLANRGFSPKGKKRKGRKKLHIELPNVFCVMGKATDSRDTVPLHFAGMPPYTKERAGWKQDIRIIQDGAVTGKRPSKHQPPGRAVDVRR